MPTNLTGLVLFVALLAPGFCHLIVAERHVAPGKQTPTPLRELASLAVVSVAADGVALAAYLLLGRVWSALPALELYLFEPTAWKQNLGAGLGIACSLVVGACLLAYAWAASDVGRRLHRILGAWKGSAWVLPSRSVEMTSSWWQVLYVEQPNKYKWVSCVLTDGSTVSGWLRSFNNRADEVGDRDLVLSAPIEVRCASVDAVSERFDFGAVVVSAHNMQLMRVEYHSEGPFGAA